MNRLGKVYLVGAGPGDPGLITLKAVECLKQAEVVVYDHLVNEEILLHAPQARLFFVGKKGGFHSIAQEEINHLLIEEAKQGRIVVRLKGGDPYLFGRGGEETEALVKARIPFEVVPGVSSAAAAPAYAGICLTHRSLSSSVAIVTGHEDPTKQKSTIDWQAVARMSTIVVLMGTKNLALIVRKLLDMGKDRNTPCALIHHGTTANQVTLVAPLGEIVEKVTAHPLPPPTVFVVGEVVKLREIANWFERKPLFGRGVVITRPKEQADKFALLLYREGARVLFFPTIKIETLPDEKLFSRAVDSIESYHWLIFTSANGVEIFFSKFRERGKDLRNLKGIEICALGPATAKAIERWGLKVDVLPDTFISEGVVEALSRRDMAGKRVLLPRAETARDVIPEGLSALGCQVDVLPLYHSVCANTDRKIFLKWLERGMIDVVTFTSPSTVHNFFKIMGEFSWPPNIYTASIGPVTASALTERGLKVHIMAKEHTIEGLMGALGEFFSRKEKEKCISLPTDQGG